MWDQLPKPEFSHSNSALLYRQQRLLSLDAPAVAADVAIFADYAMARNRNRHGIRRAGPRHSTARAGLADTFCHLLIRLRRAERDRLQVSPHAALKCGCANI